MVEKGSLIVTGGASGIGKAVHERLEKRFTDPRILDIKHQQNPIDVRDYSAVKKLMEGSIVSGEINYLFSAAGVVFFIDENSRQVVDFASAKPEMLRAMVDINLMGTINTLHAFISTMKAKKASGKIVVVSSISAFHSGGPGMAVYDATKAAITALAKRLIPYRDITINTIQPGSVRTNIGGWNEDMSISPQGLSLVKDGQDADQKRLQNEVTLEQIANVTEFLFFGNHGMNGAELTIDDGLTLLGRDGYK